MLQQQSPVVLPEHLCESCPCFLSDGALRRVCKSLSAPAVLVGAFFCCCLLPCSNSSGRGASADIVKRLGALSVMGGGGGGTLCSEKQMPIKSGRACSLVPCYHPPLMLSSSPSSCTSSAHPPLHPPPLRASLLSPVVCHSRGPLRPQTHMQCRAFSRKRIRIDARTRT